MRYVKASYHQLPIIAFALVKKKRSCHFSFTKAHHFFTHNSFDGMCPECPAEALLDMSVPEQRTLTEDLEVQQEKASFWRYCYLFASLGMVVRGVLCFVFGEYYDWMEPAASKQPGSRGGFVEMFFGILLISAFVGPASVNSCVHWWGQRDLARLLLQSVMLLRPRRSRAL
jgi:hypothetical protein